MSEAVEFLRCVSIAELQHNITASSDIAATVALIPPGNPAAVAAQIAAKASHASDVR